MPSVRAQIRSKSAWVLLLLALTAVQACNDDGRTLGEPTRTTVTVAPTSTTAMVATTAPTEFYAMAWWADGEAIPTNTGCDGDGLSPSLSWALVPAGATAIGIVAVDSSEILPDGSEYILWVAAGISPNATGIPEGSIPDDAIQGMNSAGGVGWVAPCPPAGETHRIDITVFALASTDAMKSGMSGNDMRAAIIDAAIDEFTISGSYSAPE